MDTIMIQEIQKFLVNRPENGLFLIDMPTGTGKTHAVLQFIRDYLEGKLPECQVKRFIYITRLKKNLPYKEMKSLLTVGGKPSDDDERSMYELARDFPEKVLLVTSNAESVKKGLTAKIQDQIPGYVKQWAEYKDLVAAVNLINQLNDLNSDKKRNPSAAVGTKYSTRDIETQLRNRYEPNFRKKLEKELRTLFPLPKKRLEAIKNDENWRWVKDLYPVVFTREAPVILMSVDKFFLKYSTIVEAPFFIYSSAKLLDRNTVVFIDEFDSAKDAMLNQIIQGAYRLKPDCLALFRNISGKLIVENTPADLLIPSKWWAENRREKEPCKVLDRIRGAADEISRQYHVEYHFKTKGMTNLAAKTFLFRDHRTFSLGDGNQRFVAIRRDDSARLNRLEYAETMPQREESIRAMMGRIHGFFTLFQNGVKLLANNYMQRRNEPQNRGRDDEFTSAEAVSSVLSLFDLHDDGRTYIASRIESGSYEPKMPKSRSVENTFFDRGFFYYSLEDDRNHDFQSRIRLCAFHTTPEKQLLDVCLRARVVGVSATATIPTNIGNFDLEYLRRNLGENFWEAPAADRKALLDRYRESTKIYGDAVNIPVTFLGGEKYDRQDWINLFDGKTDMGNKIFQALETYDFGDDNDNKRGTFYKRRILRIASAFKEFLRHDDIQSFLCVLTKFPENGGDLDINTIMDIFDDLCKCGGEKFKAENLVVMLKSENFESEKTEIDERLKNGEKLFVISTYQTIGSGQNLQYPIPEGKKESLVNLNDNRDSTKKDFDAIYLDRPTHIIVQMKKGLREMDLARYVYQMEYLQAAYEISPNAARERIKNAFACSAGRWTKNGEADPYATQSVAWTHIKILAQALGRINRTSMKSENIYVFADQAIQKELCVCSLSDLQSRAFNPEFAELRKAAKGESSSGQPSAAFRSVNRANYISELTNSRIKEFFYGGGWTEEKVERWSMLREHVLKHPTASENELEARDGEFYSCYVPMPTPGKALYYSQRNDFNEVAVSFTPDARVYPYAVSEENAQLTMLMRNPELKEYFQSQGYATEFATGSLIISPPLYNNIYKGALGEAAGRWAFQEAGIQLAGIEDTDLFEKFDFKVSDSDVFVDFKNWHPSPNVPDSDAEGEKIARKAAACRAKCVIVANVTAPDEIDIKIRQIENIELVEIPSLFCESDSTLNKKAIQTIRRYVEKYAISY